MSTNKHDRWNKLRARETVTPTTKVEKEKIIDSIANPVVPVGGGALPTNSTSETNEQDKKAGDTVNSAPHEPEHNEGVTDDTNKPLTEELRAGISQSAASLATDVKKHTESEFGDNGTTSNDEPNRSGEPKSSYEDAEEPETPKQTNDSLDESVTQRSPSTASGSVNAGIEVTDTTNQPDESSDDKSNPTADNLAVPSGDEFTFPPEVVSRFVELFRGNTFRGTSDADSLVEETYTRATFLIENNLLQEFDEISSQERRGFIKQFLNASLRLGLDMYEQWDAEREKKHPGKRQQQKRSRRRTSR